MLKDQLKNYSGYLSDLQKMANRFLSTVSEKFGRERSFIGIDVGTSSVKVVQMADVNGEMTILKSALVDIGGLPGSQEEILASLKTALIGVETKGARIVAVVN